MIYYVILAYDRAKMIEKIRKNAKNGCVIICDRYPSKTIGAMDSPRLSIEDCTGWFITIKNMLVNVENRLYDTMGTPDILIKIFVPIDIALSRNKNRTVPGIKENDKEIRLRHLEFHKMDYGDTKTFHVLNDKEIDSTVREIREIIWTHLS